MFSLDISGWSIVLRTLIVYTAILIGLGFQELSMAAVFLPRVKLMVRSFRLPECEQLAQAAMQLTDPTAVRALARELARQKSQEYLLGRQQKETSS